MTRLESYMNPTLNFSREVYHAILTTHRSRLLEWGNFSCPSKMLPTFSSSIIDLLTWVITCVKLLVPISLTWCHANRLTHFLKIVIVSRIWYYEMGKNVHNSSLVCINYPSIYAMTHDVTCPYVSSSYNFYYSTLTPVTLPLSMSLSKYGDGVNEKAVIV